MHPASLTQQTLRIGCFVVLALHLSLPFSLAQTSPAITVSANAASTESKEKEAVMLAPFEVVTSNDDGWLAGSSMLGNRTNQPLKDMPISVDALTKEFMEDVGAFTPEEAGMWVSNVAVQPEVFSGDGADLGTFNFRGLTNQFSANRDFFRWYGPTDNYNVERIDFGRGSNSLIFGDNDPGGQATTYTKRALPGRTFTKVLVQVGSFGSYRAQVDHNHSLNKNLAVRLNVVNRRDNRNFDWNEFNYRGYDVSLTYRPFKNTIVRLQGERSGNYRIWDSNNLVIRERAFSGLGFTNRLTVLPNGTVIDNALTATGTPDNTPLGDGTTYLRARDRTNPTGGTGQVLTYLDRDVVTPLNSAFTFRGLPEHYAFSGTASVNDREYAVWSAAVEHRFTEKLAMDLAFMQQNQWAHGEFLSSTTTANADFTGRLFTDAGLALTNRRNHMRQYRVSLTYHFDRWKWMQQFFVLRGEYRDDNNVNNGQQQRTFGDGLGVAGVRPFQRVFFTDPYPAAALTGERFIQNAPPGTRLFGTIGAGQNHLARAFSLSASGKYFGGRVQSQLGARYDDNFSWNYNQNVPGVTRDAVTGELFSLGDRHSFPDVWVPAAVFDQEKWTYNGGVVYKITRDINLYYTYSTSFRFGGINNLISEPTGPFTGTTNEVGLKMSFFKNRLAWNLAAYDLDRENIATNITRTGITDAQMEAAINYGLTPDSPDFKRVRTGGTSPDVSAQNSRGFESTFIFYPLSGLSVRLSGAYKEVTFVDAFPVMKQLIAATEARGPIGDPDVLNTIQKLKDTALVQGAAGRTVTGAFPGVTAPFSFNYVVGYRFGRDSRLKGWNAGVSGNFSGDAVLRYVAPFPDTRTVEGGSTYAVNANLGYRRKVFGHPSSFTLNVFNVFATRYPVLSATAPLADGSQNLRRIYGRPLSFRLTASTEF